VYANRNDLAPGVRLALDDSRDVYLLAYSPDPLPQDGAFHRIRVETARRGVRLRYRRGYYAPGGTTAGAVETPPDRLLSAIASPLDASEIGIEASVQEGEEIRVSVNIDPADLNLESAGDRWTGAVRLEAVRIGRLGESYGGVRQTARIALTAENYRKALADGLRFEMRLEREPKAVAVRIGAMDARGERAGSVSVPLLQSR
jgi:hypothetical protein